jgi:DNA-binding CsgD family transcriptional regulator
MSRRSSYRPRDIRRGDPLTARELQVLALVAAGETTPTISARLGIVENTIKSHLTSVYKKTGSANRVQAARHYLDRYASSAPPRSPTEPSDGLIAQQMQQIQARLDHVAPAAAEARRLQDALDALRAIDEN